MSALAYLKVTFYLNMLSQGWSESFYISGSDPVGFIYGNDPLNVPKLGSAGLQSILSTRGGLLPASAGINHIRASQVGAPHNTAGFSYGFPGYAGTFQTNLLGGTKQMNPWTRLLVKGLYLFGANKESINHYFGGIPGTCFDENMAWNFNGDWTKALGKFGDALHALACASLQRPSPANALPITSFTVDLSARTALVAPCVTGAIGGQPQSVIIRSVKVPHGWNGTHRGISVADPAGGPNPLTQIGPTRLPGADVPAWSTAKSGTIQANVLQPGAFNAFLTQRFVKRSVGRPFGVPLGRRTRP